jgi:CubicO group peptidase (beta-lactamase class C family)
MLRKSVSLVVFFVLTVACLGNGPPEGDPRVRAAVRIIEAWVDAQVDYRDIPGMSLGVVHEQDLIWSAGFGFAHVDRETPASPDTIYSICSISKLFTSVAVMQLRDQGKLRLDEPISTYLPWFDIRDAYPDAPQITLRGILSHASGLPREADFPYWTGPEFRFPTLEQIKERLAGQEELYPAFTYFQYSNLGMALLGEVVSAASGEPYAQYVKSHILDPLEMRDTTPEIPEAKRGGQLATGYSPKLRDGTRRVIPFYLVNGIAPAAGFASTVEDLARFASWQFRLLSGGEGGVLSTNTLKEMHRVHWVDPDWRTTWGLGFSVSRGDDGKTYVGHGGSCPGYRTQLLLCPKDRIAVVVMCNAHDVSPRAYADEIFELITPALLDSKKSPGKGVSPDPALEKYAGRYERPIGREQVVFVEGKELVLLSLPTDNPSGGLTRLRHIEDNVFRRIRRDGELGEAVVFVFGPDGEVTRMVRNSQYALRIR